MKWFKHDSAASIDAKLRKLRLKYGMEGYGVYWYCLELIAKDVDKNNLSFELEHDSEIISADTNIHQDLIQEMMNFMCDLGLFENAGGTVRCLKMAALTDEYTQKLLKSHDSVPTNSRQCRDKVRSNRTEEKRTEQNRIEKKTPMSRFKPPSAQEVQTYLNEKSITAFTGQQFVDHYEASGWMRGKTKIKSWKHCVGTWRKQNPEEAAEVIF